MGPKLWLYGLIPFAFVGLFVVAISELDALRPLQDSPPPAEDLTVERVQITDHGFVVKVRANSPQPLHIAQVMIDGAYWIFSQDPVGPIARIETVLIRINYPWVAGDVHHLRFVTATGATFDHAIDVALKTPRPSGSLLIHYALLGVFVGLFPVVFGMLFFPAIKSVGPEGLEFALAMTVGILGYLFIDMTLEGLDLSEHASTIFGGSALVFIPLILTVIALEVIRNGTSKRHNGIHVAIFIALGIGLHNFGEGLAIGASFSANKAALGAFLVIGFTLHNATEGIGIVSPLIHERVTFRLFAILALLAGLPTVPGIWIGAFSFSPHWAAVYFGVGAGAVLQVIIGVERFLYSRPGKRTRDSRFNRTSMAGYCVGVAIMYGTALLIAV